LEIIKFENFYFQYLGVKENTLKNINLIIEKGEKVLIAGPSGSGKSTLAHCINGLIPFSYKGNIKGNLKIKDIIPHKESIFKISEYVGTILQDQDAQFVGLSVGEDVAFTYENNKVEQNEMLESVKKALLSVDMINFINETPHNLSGGQKQRVSMAGILASDSEILLFDEPLANLDPASGKRAMEIINEIHEKTSKTIIIIEHRIEDVLEYNIDRMIVMNNGEIVANDTPDNLLSGDFIISNGLREPLYVEAIKKLGINIKKEDQISDIKNTIKYKEILNNIKYNEKNIDNINESETLIKFKNVYFKYFDDSPYTIKNINFELKKGEILSVLGNNGSGKSTIMKVLTGILKHQKGDIYYKEENINKWTIRERAMKIGYVMQNPNHMITQTQIFDEIAFGLRNFKENEKNIKEKVYDILKVCGLHEYRNWPVSALSYGQKKRLTIASILVMNPEIIILDEPTAGQDYKNYRDFMSFINELKMSEKSIIIITHDMHLALEYSDRSLVLCEGEILKEDTVYNILSNEEIIEKSNLKETSLTKLAKICGIKNSKNFINSFISRDLSGDLNE
jgi:energy-coupling factor transport system ATP-binding protein